MREALNIINTFYERVHDWHPAIREFLGEYMDYAIAQELRHNHNPEIHQTFSDLISSINELNNVEKDFMISYLESFSRDLQFNNGDYFNLRELYYLSNAQNYYDFVLYLLGRCYIEDDYNFISNICSLLRGNMPQSAEICEILLKCILDINKSNRLRERIFWIFIYDYKEASNDFYINKLGSFLKDNSNNIDLNADIIEFAHWNISHIDETDVLQIKETIRNYFNFKPIVKEKFFSSITRRLFDL